MKVGARVRVRAGVEVADADGEVVGRLRVCERLGATVVARDLLPVVRRGPPLGLAREVRAL